MSYYINLFCGALRSDGFIPLNKFQWRQGTWVRNAMEVRNHNFRGLATLLEGAGCVFMITITKFFIYLIFTVLLCCVVEENVLNKCAKIHLYSLINLTQLALGCCW